MYSLHKVFDPMPLLAHIPPRDRLVQSNPVCYSGIRIPVYSRAGVCVSLSVCAYKAIVGIGPEGSRALRQFPGRYVNTIPFSHLIHTSFWASAMEEQHVI